MLLTRSFTEMVVYGDLRERHRPFNLPNCLMNFSSRLRRSACCRVEAETRNVRTLLRAGNYEEALQAASQLFEVCTEADFQAST